MRLLILWILVKFVYSSSFVSHIINTRIFTAYHSITLKEWDDLIKDAHSNRIDLLDVPHFRCGYLNRTVRTTHPFAVILNHTEPYGCYFVDPYESVEDEELWGKDWAVLEILPVLKIHPTLLAYIKNRRRVERDESDIHMLTIDFPPSRKDTSYVREASQRIFSLTSLDFNILSKRFGITRSNVFDALLTGSVGRLCGDGECSIYEWHERVRASCSVLQKAHGRHTHDSRDTAVPFVHELGNSVHLVSLANVSGHCLLLVAYAALLEKSVISVSVGRAPYFTNSDGSGVAESGEPMHHPFHEAGLNGTGQVCGIADSGINDISCFFRDNSELYESPTTVRSHAVQSGRRKVIQYVPYADPVDSEGGHGTHTAGTLAGASLGEFSDMNGVAAGAKIAFFDIGFAFSPFLLVPRLRTTLFPTAYAAGARVHSNSWAGGSSMYGQHAYDIDAYLYENQDFLVVLASGNGGFRGWGSIGTPANAKNSLCVGATQMRNVFNDSVFLTPTVSMYGSIGPTYDGRFKPDILATGDFLVSAYSSSVSDQYRAQRIRFGKTAQERAERWRNLTSCAVHEKAGTSMSAPLVSGAALLIREYFMRPDFWASQCRQKDRWCCSFEPSGYLLKALILHSGNPVTRYSDPEFAPLGIRSFPLSSNSQPDIYQGYGSLDLKNILRLKNDAGLPYPLELFVFDNLSLSQNSVVSFRLRLRAGRSPLKVTIAWFDPPAVVGWASRLLMHDLDLLLVSPDGSLYWGNNISNGDHRNPNEQVVIPHPCLPDMLDHEECVYICLLRSHYLPIAPAQNVGVVFTLEGAVDGPEENAEWPQYEGSGEEYIVPYPDDREQVSSSVATVDISLDLSSRVPQQSLLSISSQSECVEVINITVLIRWNHSSHLPISSPAGLILQLEDSRGEHRVTISGGIAKPDEVTDGVSELDMLFLWPDEWFEIHQTGYRRCDVVLGEPGLTGNSEWVLRYSSSNLSLSNTTAMYNVTVTAGYKLCRQNEKSRESSEEYTGLDDFSDAGRVSDKTPKKGMNNKPPKFDEFSKFGSGKCIQRIVPFSDLRLGVGISDELGRFTHDRALIAEMDFNGTLRAVAISLDAFNGQEERSFPVISGLDAYLLTAAVTDFSGKSVQIGGFGWLAQNDRFYQRHWPFLWMTRLVPSDSKTRWHSLRDVTPARLGHVDTGILPLDPSAPLRWSVSLSVGYTYGLRLPSTYSGYLAFCFQANELNGSVRVISENDSDENGIHTPWYSAMTGVLFVVGLMVVVVLVIYAVIPLCRSSIELILRTERGTNEEMHHLMDIQLPSEEKKKSTDVYGESKQPKESYKSFDI